MQHLKRFYTPTLLLSIAACATTAEGTKPHDMSTAQHEAAAAREEAAAEAAASESGAGQSCGDKVCWTSVANPSEQNNADAKHHEELAEQHRAAAEALRAAEAEACAGIDEADRVTSPFFHREDIINVTKAEVPVNEGQDVVSVFAGGTAEFRAVPGMTVQWLQRLVDCHQARAASVGYSMPEMNYCPLMLKDVTATVTPAHGAFAITVTSKDGETAEEIWRRMSALAPQ